MLSVLLLAGYAALVTGVAWVGHWKYLWATEEETPWTYKLSTALQLEGGLLLLIAPLLPDNSPFLLSSFSKNPSLLGYLIVGSGLVIGAMLVGLYRASGRL